jgi:aerobic carbon-monoxide dehydrogenase medium subunit
MYLPDFTYLRPENISEVCEVLACYSGRARVLAGGTDILTKMKQEILSPEILVSLRNIGGMSDIEQCPGRGIVIGARATHSDIVNSPVLQERFLSVSTAAHSMANNQIRNIGTIGGNIINAVPSADLPPILIALKAFVILASPRGERVIPLEDFFVGPGKTQIANDEILTEIIIPEQPSTGSNYIKFGLRRSGALAVVGVSVAVTVAGNVIEDATIVLGAVAPVPMRARKTEELLRGMTISDNLLKEAGVCAAAESRPISDIRGSDEYRRDMVRVFTRRALRKAIDGGHV